MVNRELIQRLEQLSERLCYATVARHKWSQQEIETIINRYNEWSNAIGPDQRFSLKDFIMSLRDDFSFFSELNDKQFYERIKRALYRSLVQSGAAWRHHGKQRLQTTTQNSSLIRILQELEKHGVGIANDGAVLLIFPVQYYTSQPNDGYFVPSIPHAISHLQRIIQTINDPKHTVVQEAKIVIPFLQQFIQIWKQSPDRKEIFNPNIENSMNTDQYKVTQSPQKPNQFKIQKEDGTIYYCDILLHTCSCPAGQAGKLCKHLSTLLLNEESSK